MTSQAELRAHLTLISNLRQELTAIQARLDTIEAHLNDAANRLTEHLNLTTTTPKPNTTMTNN